MWDPFHIRRRRGSSRGWIVRRGGDACGQWWNSDAVGPFHPSGMTHEWPTGSRSEGLEALSTGGICRVPSVKHAAKSLEPPKKAGWGPMFAFRSQACSEILDARPENRAYDNRQARCWWRSDPADHRHRRNLEETQLTVVEVCVHMQASSHALGAVLAHRNVGD